VRSQQITIRLATWKLIVKMARATALKPSHIIGLAIRWGLSRLARGDWKQEARDFHLVTDKGAPRKVTASLWSDDDKNSAKEMAIDLSISYQSLLDFTIAKYYADWSKQKNGVEATS